MKLKVYAKLSSAGLGNKMFVWVKALLFAHKYNAELFRSSWIDFHPKAYLRNLKGEQWDWRFYGGIFKKQPLLKTIRWQYYKFFYKKIKEPISIEISRFNYQMQLFGFKKIVIVFWDIPRHPDFLNAFVMERNFIYEQLLKNLSSRTLKKYQLLQTPLISIHLRKGDLPESMRTPNEDIIKIIEFLNNRYKTHLPFCLFVDSPPSSVAEILNIPNVRIVHTNNPMIDLLHLSKSKVIIPSIISSFSTWACFFSEAIILRHPKDSVTLPLRSGENYVDYRFDSSFVINDASVLRRLDETIFEYIKHEKLS